MLADATVIQIDIGSVVTIAAAITTGLASGATIVAKLLIAYLKARDSKHTQIILQQQRINRELRNDNRETTKCLLRIQEDMIVALNDLRIVVEQIKLRSPTILKHGEQQEIHASSTYESPNK